MLHIVQVDFNLPHHAAAVLELMNEYATDPMGGGQPLSAFAQANLIAEMQKRSTVYSILAFMDQKSVGLITCIEGFSTFACRPLLNIHDVVVKREFRGQGICTAMLKEVQNLALRLGCCKLTLEVLEGNDRAQLAYRSFGFRGYELDPKMGQALFWEKKLT